MKIILNGACGRMGQVITRIAQNNEQYDIVAPVDVCGGDGVYKALHDYEGEADVIIDFSHHSATPVLLAYAVSRRIPLVIAATGHTEDEMALIKEAAKSIPVFFSYNMSMGIAVLCSMAKFAASKYPDADVEIIETHHNRKLDVPSGTALMLADAVRSVRENAELNVGRHQNGKRTKNEIGIHSLRMGNVFGEHEIKIATDNEVLTLKHEVKDRALLGDGALRAAEFIINRPVGLYGMADMVK